MPSPRFSIELTGEEWAKELANGIRDYLYRDEGMELLSNSERDELANAMIDYGIAWAVDRKRKRSADAGVDREKTRLFVKGVLERWSADGMDIDAYETADMLAGTQLDELGRMYERESRKAWLTRLEGMVKS